MKINELHTKKQEVTYNTEYDTLYHITDYHGLIESSFSNALKSKTNNYISTTYDPTMNYVVGRNFYDFKFILDAKKCAEDFGVFGVEDFHYVGDELIKMDEREIGIKTGKISPLLDYTTGMVVLINLFSKSFLQSMFYRRNDDKSRTGINALKTLKRAGVPLYAYDKGKHRPFNKNELELLSYCLSIRNDYDDFYDALEKVVNKFNIKDHFGGHIDIMQPFREKLRDNAITIINDTLTTKKMKDITSEDVIGMIERIMKLFKYGNNFTSYIVSIIQDMKLDDGFIPPFEWSSFVRDLIKNEDMENYIENFKYTVEKYRILNRETYANQHHTKTG